MIRHNMKNREILSHHNSTDGAWHGKVGQAVPIIDNNSRHRSCCCWVRARPSNDYTDDDQENWAIAPSAQQSNTKKLIASKRRWANRFSFDCDSSWRFSLQLDLLENHFRTTQSAGKHDLWPDVHRPTSSLCSTLHLLRSFGRSICFVAWRKVQNTCLAFYWPNSLDSVFYLHEFLSLSSGALITCIYTDI